MKHIKAFWIFAAFCLILSFAGTAAADVIWIPDNYTMYDKLIEDVTAVLNGKAPKTFTKEDDFSVLFRMAGAENRSSFGWIRIDVDGDGTEELLLGETDPDGKVVFYDMYTIRKSLNTIEHVFDGWDRSRWYLLENMGGLENEGSNSAMSFVDYFFQYRKGKLTKTDFVIYDGETTPDTPWTISACDSKNPEQGISATEEKALAVMAQYERRNPSLTPFIPVEDPSKK